MNDRKFAQALQEAKMSCKSESEAAVLEGFANAYFPQFADCDFEALSPQYLSGMLLTHLALLRAYDGSRPIIRVFNPELACDGFDSQHTVIEMVMNDRPFLVDTLIMCLDEQGLNVRRLGNAIVAVTRGKDGALATIASVEKSDATHCSVIFCAVDRQVSAAAREALSQALEARVDLLDVIVNDWSDMHGALRLVREQLLACPVQPEPYSMSEVLAFIDWLLDGNFTFIAYRDYRLDRHDGTISLHALGSSGLGVLRDDGNDHPSRSFADLPSQIKEIVSRPQVILLSKSSYRAPVHRPVYLDFIGFQRFDESGNVVGEHRFLGLFTASAYQLSPDQIPLLRDKYHAVMAYARLPKGGHAYKKMSHILNEFPRDELFQTDLDALYPMVGSVMHLYDRRTLRLFVRVDDYRRFVSCLIYIPRDKHSTTLRLKMQEILIDAFAGIAVEFNTQLSDASHARIHVHVRTRPGHNKTFDTRDIEKRLNAVMRDWNDEFAVQVDKVGEESLGNKLLKRFAGRYPLAYQENHSPEQAIIDSERLLGVSDDKAIAVHLYRTVAEEDNHLHLKLYGRGDSAPLTDILPKLEHFDVSVSAVHPYDFSDGEGVNFWLQQYDLTVREAGTLDMKIVHERFEEGLRKVWNGEVESDRFNGLILRAALDIDEVTVLRALSRYMIQARAPFSGKYLQQTLIAYPTLARALVELFHARLDPVRKGHRGQRVEVQREAIVSALQEVKSLDEERILRWYLALIMATVRTNFYQRESDGRRKDRLSFKFLAQEIHKLPKPRPLFEIFVYSPQMEAVHLRGGKVARGGLRWSDRMEDFRTEVLGLMKAQMVKNALIVPVGSKGGFVVKNAPGSREALRAEGEACYKTFIRGMLDLSDNIVAGTIVPPDATVRHDEDDPYLVVAADKGTATFSDLANEVAREYGFWLGDAFASGGSLGYDHKAMAITARGAWESVKYHLRMAGRDCDRDPLTVIAIGDMSGDVFGNGMLLSENIHLLAAFNHRHVFIDPDPDPGASFAERRRLFALPQSNWADYDSARISKGGGIFSRGDKSIAIGAEMKKVFAIEEDHLTPTQLINSLLKAPVDLLWNGGIGTYVKSSKESDLAVGDRGNDALRVDGNEVGAKIIAEGGNLGLTQPGRIEAAQNGVRLYTDAIDNSAGVNCSDHEVNIKILLDQIVASGGMSERHRNELLASMRDDVAALVLEQNILQPQALEMAATKPALLLDHARIIRQLESEGRLDRDIEYLPGEAEISRRLVSGYGLTRPELAVMLAYCKTWVYDHLLASELPENAYFVGDLRRYFPHTLGERFPRQMRCHPLHREIIATCLGNSLVNRMGISFIFNATQESGRTVAEVASAYTLAREIFSAREYWQRLRQLDKQISAALQLTLHWQVRELIEGAVYWLLSNLPQPIDVHEHVARFAAPVAALLTPDSVLVKRCSARIAENMRDWQGQGLAADLAGRFARLPSFSAALNIVLLAEHSGKALLETAMIWHAVDEKLNGQRLLETIASLPGDKYWDRRLARALSQRYGSISRAIVLAQLQRRENAREKWFSTHSDTFARLEENFQELSGRAPSQAMVAVILEEIAVLSE